MFYPQGFVARWFEDHHGAVDVYDGDTGYSTKLGTKGLRQRGNYIAMFVSIPWPTTHVSKYGISFVAHTYDARETLVSRNGFFMITFPSFERLGEVDGGLL